MTRIAAVLLVLTATTLHAQAPQPSSSIDAAPRQSAWIQAGIGASALALTGVVAASYRHGAHVLSARIASSATDLEGSGEITDYGVLYGRALKAGRFHLSAGAGVGRVVCEDWEPCDAEPEVPSRRSAFGVPVEVQASWRPVRFAGVGLYGHANLNRLASFAGMAATVQIGL